MLLALFNCFNFPLARAWSRGRQIMKHPVGTNSGGRYFTEMTHMRTYIYIYISPFWSPLHLVLHFFLQAKLDIPANLPTSKTTFHLPKNKCSCLNNKNSSIDAMQGLDVVCWKWVSPIGSTLYTWVVMLYTWVVTSPSQWTTILSIKNGMGPNPNGPRSVSCDRAIRYSGFFGVREKWVLLEISWILFSLRLFLQNIQLLCTKIWRAVKKCSNNSPFGVGS